MTGGSYSPVAVRQGVEGSNTCFVGVTHGVFDSTGAATPVTYWKDAFPRWVDVVGVECPVLGKDFLMVRDLGFRGKRGGNAGGEEQEGGEDYAH